MTITLLTGPAGSGKSKHLIQEVNAARASGQAVRTFLPRRAVIGAPDPNLWAHGVIGSRDPAMTASLDHIVSEEECGEILRTLRRGSLAAFDEAFYFDPIVVDHWDQAADRGIDVLVSTPSAGQLQRLAKRDTVVKRMTMRCQKCRRRQATDSFLLRGNGDTTSVCAECAAKLVSAARLELIERLEKQGPYPGERAIYQPIPLEECADWQVLRPDSAVRAELLVSIVQEVEARNGMRPESYLDVGCNTGYFCSAMSAAGLEAIGVDVVAEDIEVAALLTATIRRDRCQFIVNDVYEYLRDTRDQQIDIISAYSVIQWLMLQRSYEHGVEALGWLFEKSGQVCVLEMGYPSEEIYRGKLPANISREWVRDLMVESRRFAEVKCFPAGENGLMRDVFVGFVASAGAGLTSVAVDEATATSTDDEVLRLASTVKGLLRGESASDYFRRFEQFGLHITPVSFYQPIPDLRDLPETLWAQPSSLRGIDMNEEEQVRLVSEVFPKFSEELSALPSEKPPDKAAFYLGNGMFDGTDALVYYCMIRQFKPRRIVEVGSGFSASLALTALRQNDRGTLLAVDPFPSNVLEQVRSQLELIELPVQKVDLNLFDTLSADDILFIDSSHVTRTGGDVNHLILEVLPRLERGVLVHFHDVFLPFEYPKDWVFQKNRFWSEQYLLRAFLAFNSDFEVVLANAFLGAEHPDALRRTFPMSHWWGGGSFWIRRRLEAADRRTATQPRPRR